MKEKRIDKLDSRKMKGLTAKGLIKEYVRFQNICDEENNFYENIKMELFKIYLNQTQGVKKW